MTTDHGQMTSFDTGNQNLPPVRSADYGAAPRPIIIFGLIIAYCLAHFLIRLFTSPVFSLDEAEQLLMSQSLDWGYRFRHPPLITWIYALADMSIGLSRPVFFAIKYIIMALGLVTFYMAARIIFRWYDPQTNRFCDRNDLSAAALGAWALVYYPAWGHHEDLMHTVLLFTLLAATLHAFVAALASQSRHDWIYFGATVGLGFLAKYVHIMLPVALLMAAFSIPVLVRGRPDRNGVYQSSRLPWTGLTLALLTALIIAGPYLGWVWMNELSLAGLAQSVTSSQDAAAALADPANPIIEALRGRRDGLLSLLQALIEFTLPLPIFFLLLFWPMWVPFVIPFFPRRFVEEDENDVIWRRLMLRTMFFGVVIYLGVAALGAETFKARWMHQVLLPLPIWLFLQVQRSGPYFISMRAFGVLVAIFVVAVGAGRFVEWDQEIKSCNVAKCRAYLPVESWARALEDEGFKQGTIVGAEYQLSGNLRHQLKTARVLDAEFDVDSFPAAGPERGACMAVWRDAPAIPEKLHTYLTDALGINVTETSPQGAIRRHFLKSEDKATVLYYRYLPPTDSCH